MPLTLDDVLGYVDYLRDLGIYDFYRQPGGDDAVLRSLLASAEPATAVPAASKIAPAAVKDVAAPAGAGRRAAPVPAPPASAAQTAAKSLEPHADEMVRSVGVIKPLVEVRVAPEARGRALEEVRARIGDCTRCPLAYSGRHSIVFGEGSPTAELMFVGEGPGADEDLSGQPFVGKAGQLLNNMIGAMGLKREAVYIANVVKCRPPQNRVPEPVEAGTCAQFLADQIDIVQPRIIVALGATAATYLLGVRQSLSSLRGSWHECRGSKVAVTFHPAYLLRDPRQKGEAWKDLQRVMAELGLKGPSRA